MLHRIYFLTLRVVTFLGIFLAPEMFGWLGERLLNRCANMPWMPRGRIETHFLANLPGWKGVAGCGIRRGLGRRYACRCNPTGGPMTRMRLRDIGGGSPRRAAGRCLLAPLFDGDGRGELQ